MNFLQSAGGRRKRTRSIRIDPDDARGMDRVLVRVFRMNNTIGDTNPDDPIVLLVDDSIDVHRLLTAPPQ